MSDIIIDFLHGIQQTLNAVQHAVKGGAQPFDLLIPPFDLHTPVIGTA